MNNLGNDKVAWDQAPTSSSIRTRQFY